MADKRLLNKVEFEENSRRLSLDSGDSLSTLIGKIKKWFSDFKEVAFSGKYADLEGTPSSLPANGGTADIAKMDTAWQIICETYIKSIYVSNNDLVIVKGDNTTTSIKMPVQDIVYEISSDISNPVASSAIKSALDCKSDAWHSHNYAGSDSPGGAATRALEAATATQAVYDNNWQPILSTYIKDAVVVGNSIVFKKGDDTEFSITLPEC